MRFLKKLFKNFWKVLTFPKVPKDCGVGRRLPIVDNIRPLHTYLQDVKQISKCSRLQFYITKEQCEIQRAFTALGSGIIVALIRAGAITGGTNSRSISSFIGILFLSSPIFSPISCIF